MDELERRIATKKAELDHLRPLSGSALTQLQAYYDIELTFTSNAIEGNTLTLRETAEVIEHGLTIGGKPLRHHLEAVDHYEALLWMRSLASTSAPIAEEVICELHRRIVARSQPAIAGIYSKLPRRIAGSPAIFPNPAKIPQLMADFGAWTKAAPSGPATAFEAHFRLTAIHPFADGNGRTARLLMNLLLLRGGYPPIAIRPEDRKAYLDSLERASIEQDLVPYRILMQRRLEATLTDYVNAVREALPHSDRDEPSGKE
jgi:Fic family protein